MRRGLAALLMVALYACDDTATGPEQHEPKPSQPCEPGKQWTADCNHCSCNAEGVAVCTRMDCSAGTEKPLGAR